MKFGKVLERCISVSAPAWGELWVDYKTLKKLLYAIETTSTEHTDGSSEDVEIVIQRMAANVGEVAFFKQIRAELSKVSSHYNQCEQQLAEKYSQIVAGLGSFITRHGSRSTTPSTTSSSTATSSSSSTFLVQSTPEQAQEATRLFAAIVSLTSSLILLENYAVMNYCGFGKALKKHDKQTKTTTKYAVMKAWVNGLAFASHPILLRMLQGTQDAYSLLVALQPVEARVGVNADEARKLLGLRDVKEAVSSIQRKKKDVGGAGGAGGAMLTKSASNSNLSGLATVAGGSHNATYSGITNGSRTTSAASSPVHSHQQQEELDSLTTTKRISSSSSSSSSSFSSSSTGVGQMARGSNSALTVSSLEQREKMNEKGKLSSNLQTNDTSGRGVKRSIKETQQDGVVITGEENGGVGNEEEILLSPTSAVPGKGKRGRQGKDVQAAGEQDGPTEQTGRWGSSVSSTTSTTSSSGGSTEKKGGSGGKARNSSSLMTRKQQH